ncbi:MAG: hypothetical protein JWN89_134 [Parcubacteria group bacterium]|nr:hypothetical protein [Parcubacteria group bacterium]
MKTPRFLVASIFVFSIAACSSDSLVAPERVSPNQTAVMTVSTAAVGPQNYWTGIHTGLSPIDSSDWQLNLTPVATDTRSSYSFIAPSGTKFPLALIPYGTGGSESNGTSKATYSFATDWAPIDAGKHPGIRIESASEILLTISEYSRTNPSFGFQKATFERLSTTATFVNIKKEFPADKNVGHFVLTRRIYNMTCVGNDSITFASSMGVVEQASRADGFDAGVVPQKVYSVQVKCGLYADISAARSANPNLQ